MSSTTEESKAIGNLKSVLTILSLTAIIGCVSVQQQLIDNQTERLSHYEPLEVTISKEIFLETLNPITDGHSISFENGRMKIYAELMNKNFQSEFSIPDYGDIYAGELTRKYDRQLDDPLEIIQDNLLFTINFGGGGSGLVAYKLIWNGQYYMTDGVPTVDLVFSFKDLDPQRANIHRYIGYDLSPLQSSETNQMNVNFLGYNKLLKYEY